MLRYIIALGALAAVTAPATAQVDTSRDARRYAFDAGSREGWLGIGISCSRCTLSEPDDGEARQWTFSEPPLVFSVDRNGPADRAALRTGDTLVAIDGMPFTSAQGGTAFANIRPGQSLRLTYRRSGTERTVRLIAMRHPPETRNLEYAARAMRRAQEEQQRDLELSRGQLERSGRELERVRAQMEQMAREHQNSGMDSARLESLRRALDEQAIRLNMILEERRALERQEELAIPPMAAMPPMPATPATPPMAAVPAIPAMPPMAAIPPTPPMSYREHRQFGPVRYTGRIGDVVIEARGPGGLTATEVSEGEVLLSSGDLSVRLTLRPRGPARPAAPKAAQPPVPARPPRD
jgi:hypothetical protein